MKDNLEEAPEFILNSHFEKATSIVDKFYDDRIEVQSSICETQLGDTRYPRRGHGYGRNRSHGAVHARINERNDRVHQRDCFGYLLVGLSRFYI